MWVRSPIAALSGLAIRVGMRSMVARRDRAARLIFERLMLACKLFTKPLNGLKTTFPKWSETNPF
jgi:hypothetical protein